jgi:membrane protease YdiL (CAAX protease family)
VDSAPFDDNVPSVPERPEVQPIGGRGVPPMHPAFAAIQVFLVCGIPTQLVVFVALIATGSHMGSDGSWLTVEPSKISLEFFATSSLFDTALVAILIRVFLALSGESSRDVFLGPRRVGGEIVRGLALLPALWIGVVAVVFALSKLAPGLHNVSTNPLEAYLDSPFKAAIFILVVILAGGVREELQRGFILHRFDQGLGGAWVGLLLFSIAFGLFHVQQGYDVAIAVGALGVVWGLLYIRRRSVVAPMVSHAGFDVIEVLQQVVLRSLGK